MSQQSRITSEVDFGRDGKQQGFLRLPHSVHRSAYGWIPIPIIVIKHGTGPTVLLTAANHGDEYEGQIALMKLCRELQPKDVRGRLIILTATNYPAAIAGTRTSPIDGGNLNRSFPGEPDGRPTQAIAHYVESELLSRADFVIDLHSGGSSLMYLPSALVGRVSDPKLATQQLEMLKAFAAPIGYVGASGGADLTLLSGAERAGVPGIGTELGGAGSTSVHSLQVAERGVRRVLKYLGAVPDMDVGPEPPPSRIVHVGGNEYFVYSPDYGIWEPLAELGDEVQAGQPAAAVHSQQTPWREPVVANFLRSGTVLCKRVPGGVQRGDCLYHLATDEEP